MLRLRFGTGYNKIGELWATFLYTEEKQFFKVTEKLVEADVYL